MRLDLNQHQETWPSLWQEIVNLITEIADVPIALIMRKKTNSMEVIVTSNNDKSNPYHLGDEEAFCHNLYCHHVIQTDSPLLIQNALKLDK